MGNSKLRQNQKKEGLRHRLKVERAVNEKFRTINDTSSETKEGKADDLDNSDGSLTPTSVEEANKRNATSPPVNLLAKVKKSASIVIHDTPENDSQVSYSYTSVLTQFRRFQSSKNQTSKALRGSAFTHEAEEMEAAMSKSAKEQLEKAGREGHEVEHNRDELNALRHTAEKEFHHIFFFQKPEWYFLSVELCLMFNCLYMSLWLTNAITICYQAHFENGWDVIDQFAMVIPSIICGYSISYITSTCSVLEAISELDVEVVSEVLTDMDEARLVVEELRQKIFSMADEQDLADKKEFISRLFAEIDEDGSGTLDSDEFRELLRSVHLTYSDYRYRLLFAAVDTSGNGLVSEDELQEFLFPHLFVKSTSSSDDAEKKFSQYQY